MGIKGEKFFLRSIDPRCVANDLEIEEMTKLLHVVVVENLLCMQSLLQLAVVMVGLFATNGRWWTINALQLQRLRYHQTGLPRRPETGSEGVRNSAIQMPAHFCSLWASLLLSLFIGTWTAQRVDHECKWEEVWETPTSEHLTAIFWTCFQH